MKQNLLMLLCLPLVLAACGKSDESVNSGTAQQVVSSNAVTSYNGTYFPQIENEYGRYYVSYSFYENGCYTGRHRISGYDHESTKQRLCQRLQEDWPNRGCARGMRQAYFSNVCPGIAFSPQ